MMMMPNNRATCFRTSDHDYLTFCVRNGHVECFQREQIDPLITPGKYLYERFIAFQKISPTWKTPLVSQEINPFENLEFLQLVCKKSNHVFSRFMHAVRCWIMSHVHCVSILHTLVKMHGYTLTYMDLFAAVQCSSIVALTWLLAQREEVNGRGNFLLSIQYNTNQKFIEDDPYLHYLEVSLLNLYNVVIVSPVREHKMPMIQIIADYRPLCRVTNDQLALALAYKFYPLFTSLDRFMFMKYKPEEEQSARRLNRRGCGGEEIITATALTSYYCPVEVLISGMIRARQNDQLQKILHVCEPVLDDNICCRFLLLGQICTMHKNGPEIRKTLLLFLFRKLGELSIQYVLQNQIYHTHLNDLWFTLQCFRDHILANTSQRTREEIYTVNLNEICTTNLNWSHQEYESYKFVLFAHSVGKRMVKQFFDENK